MLRIEPIPRDGVLPISVPQLPQLKLHVYRWAVGTDGGAGIQSHITRVLDIVGHLDVVLLEKCIRHVITRHEALRTSYWPALMLTPVVCEGWGPVCRTLGMLPSEEMIPWFRRILYKQSIHSEFQFKIDVVDLDKHSGLELEHRVEEEILRAKGFFFEFWKVPMIRVSLLRLRATEYKLIIMIPHLVADAASLTVCLQEAFKCYGSKDPAGSCLPKQRLHQVDLAEYQRLRRAQHEEMDRDGPGPSFSLLDTSTLKFHRHRPVVVFGLAHIERRSERLQFTGAKCEWLRMASRKLRATTSMVVFACYTALLHLFAGSNRFGVFITQNNRIHTDLESVVGFIALGRSICVLFAENATFANALDDARIKFSEAISNGGMQKEPLLEHERHYCAMFEAIRSHDYLVAGLSIEEGEFPTTVNRDDCGLTLRVYDRGSKGITVSLNYCPDCFSEQAMVAFSAHMGEMLGNAVRRPDARLKDLVPGVFCESGA